MKNLIFLSLFVILLYGCSDDNPVTTPPPPPTQTIDTITLLVHDSIWVKSGRPKDSLMYNCFQNVDTLRIDFTLNCYNVEFYTLKSSASSWSWERIGSNYNPPISFDSTYNLKAVVNSSSFTVKNFITTFSYPPGMLISLKNIRIWYVKRT